MKKYVRNSNSVSGRLSDELVMMDLDKGKYFYLNAVATRIWDILEKPYSLDEVCSLLMEEYEVGEEQCRTDVTEVISEMVKQSVVLELE